MSNDASKEEILSSEEIEALVERTNQGGFDDGEWGDNESSFLRIRSKSSSADLESRSSRGLGQSGSTQERRGSRIVQTGWCGGELYTALQP